MENLPILLVSLLQTLPPEILLIGEFLVCCMALMMSLIFFGAKGLYVYIVIAIIMANVQVLKLVQFDLYSHPVALGTVLFATSYLATDILVEQFGKKAGQKAIIIGFSAFLWWMILILLTLGYSPLTSDQTNTEESSAVQMHHEMMHIFLPQVRFFIAGVVSYLISQMTDIWLYHGLKILTRGRFLWLRNNVSTMLSALIDNTIFSILAWVILAPEPMPWDVLIGTYILGTYGLRVIIAACDTPILYLARWIIRLRARDGDGSTCLTL